MPKLPELTQIRCEDGNILTAVDTLLNKMGDERSCNLDLEIIRVGSSHESVTVPVLTCLGVLMIEPEKPFPHACHLGVLHHIRGVFQLRVASGAHQRRDGRMHAALYPQRAERNVEGCVCRWCHQSLEERDV